MAAFAPELGRYVASEDRRAQGRTGTKRRHRGQPKRPAWPHVCQPEEKK